MKKILSIILAILTVLSLTGCLPDEYENVNDTPEPNRPAPKSVEELYSIYDALERGMTKDEIDELFGEGEARYDEYGDVKFYNYFNEKKSAGASVTYDYDNVIETKTLYFNHKSNLIPFSGRFDSDKVPLVKADVTVQGATDIMETVPLELSCTYDKSGPVSMKKLYGWYNEDGSNFILHTENGLITNVVYYGA